MGSATGEVSTRQVNWSSAVPRGPKGSSSPGSSKPTSRPSSRIRRRDEVGTPQ